MPNLAPVAGNSYTALQIILDALYDLGALAVGEALPNDSAQLCLRKLNRLIDVFNARNLFIYSVNFSVFNLKANHQPHTMGPDNADDFVVGERPISIKSAALIIPTQVDVPLKILDDDDWADIRLKNLTSSIPTSLYYSPDYPTGNVYFWPISSSAYQVRLELRSQLSQFAKLNTIAYVPQGYIEAIISTLAVALAPAFAENGAVPPAVAAASIYARSAVQSNNSASPKLQTRDLGMPKGGSRRTSFNYRTGGLTGGGK